MADVQHATVHFSGRVQGVGFRYTTLQVAKEFEVSGYVRNLPDGRVELEAEGSAEEVKRFVDSLKERMHGYIRKAEEKTERREGVFRGFTIK